MEAANNLINLIKNSGLSEMEKKEWEVILKNSPKIFLDSLQILTQRFPNIIEWLNETYQKKKEAFRISFKNKEEAHSLFQEIYEKEKEYFKQLKVEK